MARRIEHRSTSAWSAKQIYQAMTDVTQLKERLRDLGGSAHELLSHEPTETGFRFHIAQGVPADLLPAVARTAVGGDLHIDRSESWREADDEHFTGEIAAEVAGVPCVITGSRWLREVTDADGKHISELVTEGEVRVNVPLIGGKLESVVADEVSKLLDAEYRFTTDWLTRVS